MNSEKDAGMLAGAPWMKSAERHTPGITGCMGSFLIRGGVAFSPCNLREQLIYTDTLQYGLFDRYDVRSGKHQSANALLKVVPVRTSLQTSLTEYSAR